MTKAEALQVVLDAARQHAQDDRCWRDVAGPAYFESNMRRFSNRQRLYEAITVTAQADPTLPREER